MFTLVNEQLPKAYTSSGVALSKIRATIRPDYLLSQISSCIHVADKGCNSMGSLQFGA